MKKTYCAASSLVLAFVFAQPARAQDAPQDSGLGEIIVTARREAENLQTVPVTVSAFNGEDLRAKSISQPIDLQQSVSGIFLSGSGSTQNAQYSVRGVSKPVAGAGAPGVVTYFADVPLPFFVSSTPQYDLKSIQVLKGPQGTLFGRNTVGGALLIDPVGPSSSFDGYLQGTLGNFDTRVLEGAVNIPLVNDKLALRVAGRIDKADGYYENLGVGGDLQNQDDENFRASLLFTPNDWITNTTIIDYAHASKDSNRGAAQIALGSGLPVPAVQALIDAQRSRGPYVVNTGPLAQFDGWHNWGLTNRTDLDFGAITVTNIFGVRDVMDDSLTSFDGLPGPFFDSYQKAEQEQYSDELQVRGKLMDGKLSWLLGGFYLETPPNRRVNDSDLAVLGVPNTPLQYNFYKETSKAAFVNLSYELTDTVKLNGGFRYTWDEYSSCGGLGELDRPAGIESDDCLSALSFASKVEGSSSAPTWTVGVDWQATDDVFVYLTSREGYKAGGLNSPRLGTGLAAFQTFKPEKTTDIEIGVKSKFDLGPVATRLNVSAFQSWTKDKQIIGTQVATSTYQLANLACTLANPSPFIDGDCDLTNDPSATVLSINGGDTELTGLEYDLTLAPMQGLTLTAAGTILSQKTSSYSVPAFLAPFFPGGGIPLLFTPEKSFTFGVNQEVPLGDNGSLNFNGQVYFSDKVDFYGYVADTYTVVNGRIDWNNMLGRPVDLSFYIRNAFEEEYVSGSALTSPTGIPSNSVLYGQPRTYGVSLRYRFGASAESAN